MTRQPEQPSGIRGTELTDAIVVSRFESGFNIVHGISRNEMIVLPSGPKPRRRITQPVLVHHVKSVDSIKDRL